MMSNTSACMVRGRYHKNVCNENFVIYGSYIIHKFGHG